MNNDNKTYREIYQKWMDKQAEINKVEAQLSKLQRSKSTVATARQAQAGKLND